MNAGDTFGRWTVLQPSGDVSQFRRALCQCSCGIQRMVSERNLRDGRSQNCGCERMAAMAGSNTKHGKWKSSEYKVWSAMKARCNKKHKNYGARGIFVCERWASNFAAFYADMGSRPSTRHTIERINNDGNYEPSNCRWATYAEQGRNKRSNVNITYNGETKTIADWSTTIGIDFSTLHYRLVRGGWPIARALTEPTNRSK